MEGKLVLTASLYDVEGRVKAFVLKELLLSWIRRLWLEPSETTCALLLKNSVFLTIFYDVFCSWKEINL